MKKRFTERERINGQLATRFLSKKAMKFYETTDPIDIYEYKDDDGETLYAYDFAGDGRQDLTWDQLQKEFEEIQDELDELDRQTARRGEEEIRKGAAQARYDAENTRQVKLKLNKKTDADILAKLDAEENVQGYIKRLIREDIEG